MMKDVETFDWLDRIAIVWPLTAVFEPEMLTKWERLAQASNFLHLFFVALWHLRLIIRLYRGGKGLNRLERLYLDRRGNMSTAVGGKS